MLVCIIHENIILMGMFIKILMVMYRKGFILLVQSAFSIDYWCGISNALAIHTNYDVPFIRHHADVWSLEIVYKFAG